MEIDASATRTISLPLLKTAVVGRGRACHPSADCRKLLRGSLNNPMAYHVMVRMMDPAGSLPGIRAMFRRECEGGGWHLCVE